MVVLSALNPPPVHFHFMEGLGISGDEVRTAHYRTAVYQAVMRISIRNPQDTTHKGVVVMDRDTAEWLADLFPGASVEPLDGMGVLPRKGKAGRPRKHKSDADKVKAHRDQRKREWLAQLDLINATSLVTGRYPFFDQEVRAGMRELARNEFPLLERDSVTPQSAPLTCGTAFGSIYDRVPLDHVDYEDDDAFIAGLRALHGRVVAKEEAGLFSPAHFDPDKAAGTGRGLDNVTHLRGIWLDNDGGDLTHATFAGLFPYLRVVVWNTASSTAEKPRWRAFIPTTCAMSMDVHALILAQIVKVLNREGYWGARQLEKQPRIKSRLCHGFDEGKFNAASLFYLPVQAKDPAHSFFLDYGADDPSRGPLDLHVWIDECVLRLRPDPEPEPVPIGADDAGAAARGHGQGHLREASGHAGCAGRGEGPESGRSAGGSGRSSHRGVAGHRVRAGHGQQRLLPPGCGAQGGGARRGRDQGGAVRAGGLRPLASGASG